MNNVNGEATLTPRHYAFDLTLAPVAEDGSTKRTREFTEALNTAPVCVRGHRPVLQSFARVLEAQRHVVTSQI